MSNTILAALIDTFREALRETISRASESTLVRLTVLAIILGAVPFYILSMAVAALGGN